MVSRLTLIRVRHYLRRLGPSDMIEVVTRADESTKSRHTDQRLSSLYQETY